MAGLVAAYRYLVSTVYRKVCGSDDETEVSPET